MEKSEFIREVIDEISASCSLPLFSKEKEITRILDRSKRWFYRNYEYAVEQKYIALEKQLFSTELFKTDKAITLPDAVVSVYDVKEGYRSAVLQQFADPDLSLERFIMQDIGPLSGGKNLVYYVAAQLQMDTARSMVLQTIKYSFNINTKKLRFLGQVPSKNIVITVDEEIPEASLLDDPLFFDYVVAKVKKQIGRILGTFQFNLIGNAQINFDLIKQEGDEELEKVEQKINDIETTDYFFMVN